MVDVNYIFLITLIIIVLGYIIKRLNIISEENGKVIAKIIFNITLPATILIVTSNIEFNLSLVLIPVIIITFSLCVLLFAFILFRNTSKNTKGILLMNVIGFNVVHLAFPLVEGIWGENGFQYIALVDIGNGIIVFVVCCLIGAIYSPLNNNNDRKRDLRFVGKKLIKSTPLFCYAIALIINFSGIIIPIFVMDILLILSRANTALTLLLLGIFLNFKFQKSELSIIFKILVIRYSFGLIVGLILFYCLPFNHTYRIIILISLILPVGIAVIPFSVDFNYNQELVNMIVTLTIIISFILMWILILILN